MTTTAPKKMLPNPTLDVESFAPKNEISLLPEAPSEFASRATTPSVQPTGGVPGDAALMSNIEASVMAIAVKFRSERAVCAFYETDANTGAAITIFYADDRLAQSFGGCGAAWYWRSRQHGNSVSVLSGPFITSYDAYRDAMRQMAR